MATNTLTDVYLIDNSAKNVNLEIKIGGQNQTGSTQVEIPGITFTPANFSGNLLAKAIASNSSLHKKKLKIIATIADTSLTTNYTSLDIILSGGLSQKTYSLHKTVDSQGKSADYVCIIKFFDSNKP